MVFRGLAPRMRAGTAVAAPLVFGILLALAPAGIAHDSPFRGHSLLFNGSLTESGDLLQIQVDDPATATQGPVIDVGAESFTLEFWMRAKPGDNPEDGVYCGANEVWRQGNVIIDRNRVGLNRKYGLSIAGGKVVFGVSAWDDRTICGTTDVRDDSWHHIAVTYNAESGAMALFVDGDKEATGSVDGGGDISYPDDGLPGSCGGLPCSTDTYLAIGSSKRNDTPDYRGYLDELRYSMGIRYTTSFARPTQRFEEDIDTLALYHFDDGAGSTARDSLDRSGLSRVTDSQQYPKWTTSEPFPPYSGGSGATPRPTQSGGVVTTLPPQTNDRSTQPDEVIPGSTMPSQFAFGNEPSGDQSPKPKQRKLSASPRSDGKGASVPPFAIALLGVGVAIFIAARFLRGDRL